MNELVQLGLDLYYGKTDKFSAEDANDAFRKSILEICGGKADYKALSNPMIRHNVFNLITETIDQIIPRTLEGQFDQFVETKNLNWGDSQVFEVSDPSLFKVATIANGTTNVRMQRLDKGSLTVPTKMRFVKIYEEFYRFISGRINWVEMVNRVAASFALQIKSDIYTGIYASYSALSATYGVTGTFSVSAFNTMVAHVQAAANTPGVVAFGTKLALAKVTPSAGFTAYPGLMNQEMMGQVNMQGYLGNLQGTPLVELANAHVAGTDNFVIDDSFILIVPMNSEKIVKLVFEGESIITDNAFDQNADMSKEYGFGKQYGLGILSASKYGFYKLS